jgi:hypothetical protein
MGKSSLLFNTKTSDKRKKSRLCARAGYLLAGLDGVKRMAQGAHNDPAPNGAYNSAGFVS